LQSPQEVPTSGFPCTTDVTAYSALSPGHCPPSLHRTPCGSSHGCATFPSCNLSTSLGCQDHTALPYALCCGRQSRRSRSLLRTSTASAPRSLHNVPAAFRVHRDPACESDVGQRPSSVDRNDSSYTLDDILRQVKMATRAIFRQDDDVPGYAPVSAQPQPDPCELVAMRPIADSLCPVRVFGQYRCRSIEKQGSS